jgi:hypothetical protein
VQQNTALHVSPSCVALVVRVSPGHLIDHGLVFVCDVAEPETPAPSRFEWVSADEMENHTKIADIDRKLIPRLLTSDHPLSVVLGVEDGGSHILAISAIDPARLSPLVFATVP